MLYLFPGFHDSNSHPTRWKRCATQNRIARGPGNGDELETSRAPNPFAENAKGWATRPRTIECDVDATTVEPIPPLSHGAACNGRLSPVSVLPLDRAKIRDLYSCHLDGSLSWTGPPPPRTK